MIWLAVSCLALGTVGIVRGAAIVAVSGAGRFPGDAAASLLVGFALAVTGQLLLDHL